MEEKRIRVIIIDERNEECLWCIELTPEQMKLLEWLYDEQLLFYDCHIEKDIEFETI